MSLLLLIDCLRLFLCHGAEASQREEVVTHPVEVLVGTGVDRFGLEEGHKTALGPPTNSAGDVQLRSGQATGWKNEILQRRQLLRVSVNPLLERICVVRVKSSLVDLALGADLLGLAGCGHVRAQIQQTSLQLFQLLADFGRQILD